MASTRRRPAQVRIHRLSSSIIQTDTDEGSDRIGDWLGATISMLTVNRIYLIDSRFFFPEDYPLVTVQRILHLINSRTERWGFKRTHDTSSDRDLLQYFLWSKLEGPASTPLTQDMRLMIQNKSVIVAYQPPWVLSPHDMKQFANCEVSPH